jgi:cation transport protein ChaC
MAAEGGSSDAAAPQWDAAQGVWVGERAVSSSGGALEVPDPLWVFGYGSLCWRIDDEYEELLTARVHGWRRRMAQKSCDHRGTPEAPGVVATMMPESEWRALGLTP